MRQQGECQHDNHKYPQLETCHAHCKALTILVWLIMDNTTSIESSIGDTTQLPHQGGEQALYPGDYPEARGPARPLRPRQRRGSPLSILSSRAIHWHPAHSTSIFFLELIRSHIMCLIRNQQNLFFRKSIKQIKHLFTNKRSICGNDNIIIFISLIC